MKKPRFSSSFRTACRIVAQQCHGRKGVWAYEIFEYINQKYFADRLPYVHILWSLTPYGGCVAWSSCATNKSRPPIIALHPALLGEGEKPAPWSIPRAQLGPALVY